MIDTRLEDIKQAGLRISQAAETLKETADQLRADVDTLTTRVDAIEIENKTVASELVNNTERVQTEQVVQDGRLDTLET